MAGGTTALITYAVAKNAAATLVLSMPVAVLVASLPDISTDAIFWGAAGGAVRWMATRQTWGSGLLGVCIGAIMAAGLIGANIPFLSDILPSKETAGHATPFLTGTFGVTIFGAIQDIISFKRGKPE